MKDKTKNKKQKTKQKSYQGPFPKNKNLEIQMTRKYMKTEGEGPTVDAFSYQDTTDSLSRDNERLSNVKRPKRKRNVIKQWWKEYTSQIIIGTVMALLSFFFGKFVYDHSNHLVEHDKDIEHLQKEDDRINKDIEKLEDRYEETEETIYELDKKIEIQQVKIDYKKN